MRDSIGAPMASERTLLAYEATFIPAHGTGPERADATRRVLEATGIDLAGTAIEELEAR
jgi:hypothetical protein